MPPKKRPRPSYDQAAASDADDPELPIKTYDEFAASMDNATDVFANNPNSDIAIGMVDNLKHKYPELYKIWENAHRVKPEDDDDESDEGSEEEEGGDEGSHEEEGGGGQGGENDSPDETNLGGGGEGGEEREDEPTENAPAANAEAAGTQVGNAYNDFQGTGGNEAVAQSQAFQRISGAGAAGYTPTQMKDGEKNRDKEGAGYGSKYLAPDLRAGGDSSNSEHKEAENTLRAQYQLDPLANQVVPSANKQIQSDVLFDMFSVVPPGFGQGVDNKLVHENEARETAIRFKEPLYTPRFEHGGADIGIAQHIHPLPWQLQPNDTGAQIIQHLMKLEHKMKMMKSLLMQASKSGEPASTLPGTTNRHASSKGLERLPTNELEPVVHNRSPWEPVAEAPGYALNKRGFRHTHSPWASPFQREYDYVNSGPTMQKRRALEVILP